ncbi:MAG: tetratricopeptide repeat protein, partial [Gammaproteobacteria bacterium]|nr:tetratricopeptide repeat protein [Gammaproteobacteria bacterium]
MTRSPAKKLKQLLPAIAFLFSITCLAGPYEDGVNAAKLGDYQTALNLWKPLADKGDAKALYQIGRLYRKGLGVEKDFGKAFHYFLNAGQKGHARAQYNVGFMLQNGKGVKPSMELAKKWYEVAARQGDTIAKQKLKNLEQEALGIVNRTKSDKPISKEDALLVAAEHGNLEAIVSLLND